MNPIVGIVEGPALVTTGIPAPAVGTTPTPRPGVPFVPNVQTRDGNALVGRLLTEAKVAGNLPKSGNHDALGLPAMLQYQLPA